MKNASEASALLLSLLLFIILSLKKPYRRTILGNYDPCILYLACNLHYETTLVRFSVGHTHTKVKCALLPEI